MSTEAYPLQWPEGQKRANRPERSRFKATFARARDNLIDELKRLGANIPVLSSNIELRRDGLPYAGRPQPLDTGVAVYFQYKKQQMCFACDKYDRVVDNIQAINKTIDALRGIKRWGTGDMMERAFSGFVALPDNSGDNWRNVLNAHNMTFPEVEQQFKRLRSLHHPDKGGDPVMFQKINKAWEQAND
ncbi:MAG: hypothetical protein ABUJ92_00185 [Desulfobacterales bacterium]